ncbi:selenide, water dikinase SelD, partial [Campylobacter jejuni]
VTGKVHPSKFIANNTSKIGDCIILTKPLGTGILSTALKAQMLEEKHLDHMLESMMGLNYKSSQIALRFGVNAMSDVTGFGFLGHLREMLNDSISFMIFKDKLPYLEGVKEYFDMGLIPGGAYKNLDFIQEFYPGLNEEDLLLCDPQTSGGLLISIEEKKALECLKALEDENIKAKIVAKAVAKQDDRFIFS